MKTNQKYILNKDLDLRNENFLVKKGTQLKVIRLFDEKDENMATKAGIKFDRINGNYLIDENDFNEKVADETFKLVSTQKYATASCVKHSLNGNGKIVKYWHDPDFDLHLYTVEFNSKIEVVLEKNLEAIPC